MNSRIYVGTGILILGLGTYLYLLKTDVRRSLCDRLSCIRMEGASAFTRSEIYSDSEDTYRALYTQGNQYLRLEAKKTALTEAEHELNASVARMKALFEKAPAPYPGDISDAIVCDPAFVPVYAESNTHGNKIAYFIGYLNDRLTFGSCSQDQATYRGIMAFTYCPKQGLLLRVELISPTQEFNAREKELTSAIQGLTCPP